MSLKFYVRNCADLSRVISHTDDDNASQVSNADIQVFLFL